jgi:hypothetical protein
MNRRLFVSLAILVAIAIAGCGRSQAPAPGGDEVALRAALENYLSERTGLNLPAMDIVFEDVKVEGDTAHAQVEFRTKDGQGAMQMGYAFERKDGVWTVKGAEASGMSTGHPVPGAAPAPDSGQLPAGHPPIAQPEKAQPSKRP